MDRVACAWLIKNFIDADAEFLFVSPRTASEQALPDGAIPFVIPGVELSRRGDRTTFDVMLEKYQLSHPALSLLADILRAADLGGPNHPAAEGAGLKAIVHGFFLLGIPDPDAIARQLPLFDALYGYCQDRTRTKA